MQTEYIRAGSTDVRISVDQIIDSSTLASVTNTAGRGLTGLAFNTASLTCFYFREDNGNNVSDQLALVTYTRGATHTDGGFVEQDATNSPGDYWLCLSDAMVASGAGWCKITLKGAANMVQKSIKIVLTQAATEITALTTELAKVPKSDSSVTWNATALASIQTEANDALVANHLDHLLAVDYDPASKPGVATALLNELIESDAGVSRFTVNALEQAPTGGSAPTAAAISDAVWDKATAGHTTSGTFGEQTVQIGLAGAGLTNINLPNQTMDIIGNITGNLSGSVGSVTAGVTLAAAAITAIWAALTSALTTVGSIGKLVVDNLNATVSSRSTHTAADTWAVGTRVLTAGTNIVLAKGTGITGFNDLSGAQVNTEADSAIETYHLHRLFAATYDPAAKPGVSDALLNELVESDAGVARFTANSLEQGVSPTSGEIADAVWDEGIVGHLGAGSTGAALNAAGSAGDPWTTPLPGAYGNGTAGKILGDNLNATVSSRADDVDQAAIKAKTDQLNFSKANEVDANAQSFNGVTITGFGTSGDKFGV